MSLPETCPFCGAAVGCGVAGSWVGFSCLTSIHVGQEVRRTQSRKCEVSERNRLLDRVAELEARCKRLEEVGDMIVAEYMVVDPEKSAWRKAKEAKP